MNVIYCHYLHNAAALAHACRCGAAALREEAAQALAQGQQSRHASKVQAAEFVEWYADTVDAGRADLDHAQIVAHAANMSGILIDPRTPDDPHKAQWDPDGHRAEQEHTAQRKHELQSAAAAGLLRRIAEPGQVAFYTLMPDYTLLPGDAR